MKNTNEYEINWKNVDLTSGYNRSQNILEGYTFDDLLLEVHCNLGDRANSTNVRKHAQDVLKAKYEESLEIMYNNLENITKYHINGLEE